jgi:DNA-binding NtrC family response regulator
MKLSAYDYLTKPFDVDQVLFSIRRALTQRTLVDQMQALSRDRADDGDDEEELVGRTPCWRCSRPSAGWRRCASRG